MWLNNISNNLIHEYSKNYYISNVLLIISNLTIFTYSNSFNYYSKKFQELLCILNR